MYPIEINEIKKYLDYYGVTPSIIRVEVFRYLAENRNHPTVDNIYKELKKKIFTLSKATIYNTLNLFLEKNIVAPVYSENGELRYDVDVKNHGHFKCITCGGIYDFNVMELQIMENCIENFKILETHIILKGICFQCKKND